MNLRQRLAVSLLFLTLLTCHSSGSQRPIAIRLTELYKRELVQSSGIKAAPPIPRTEWRFNSPSTSEEFPETGGWEAGPGVQDLAIRKGVLYGKSTNDFPIIHLERKSGLEDRDVLHAIEIRMRVSAGTKVSISYEGAEKIDLKNVVEQAKDLPWSVEKAVTPGKEMQTYTLTDRRPPMSVDMRHLLIRPTDVAGATFEIESIRLIFRKEYLAGIASGVRWEGLSQIFHETIVSHASEDIRFATTLPKHPWLDVSIGTLENRPVTFRATVHDDSDEKQILEQTITMPNRWEPVLLDLSGYANRKITLKLSLRSENANAVGFWGSPVIREKNPMPNAADRKVPPPQGVILIWADTLRRDHLDVYGYNRPTAPNIHRLASEGTLVQDCISQATWTKVATPSLMTSLYPTSHGVHDFTDRLPSSATTMAEIFQRAGYATLSFSSILFTGAFTNLHQGFDELHEDTSLPDRNSSKTARIYVDRFLPWLEAHRDFPFFVFLHVSDPHDPYRPYPPYDTLWADPAKNSAHEEETKEVRSKISDPLLKAFGMPTRNELEKAGFDADEYMQQDRDWYDGSIRAMDAEIGRLTERLETLGLDRKTLVVFVGDHGEAFLEHGRSFHGQDVYGELTNIPLILWGPGFIPKGKIIHATLETIDVMPTILELGHLPTPAEAQGKSFASLLFGPSGKSIEAIAARTDWGRPAITEKAVTTESVGAPPPRDTESYSIVFDGWKLIHNTKRAAPTPEFELFDEQKDPLNLVNLASKHPEVVKRLAQQLEAWHKAALSKKLKPDAETTRGLSQEEIERLRSLGYLSN